MASAAQPIRSPSYPNMSLPEAVEAVGKIEKVYRATNVDREAAVKLMGYTALSGPANKSLAALALYGLVERAGKGQMRVTARAKAILHPDNDTEKREQLRYAAFEPSLFRELQDRFPGITPPYEGLETFLNRRGFNQTAIRPAARAYLDTLLFLEQSGVTESHGNEHSSGAESPKPDRDNKPEFGGARVGDLIQWEVDGVLQMEKPMRVRLVHANGQYVAVDGSETGIPMDQVIVEQRAPEGRPQPPMFPLGLGELSGHEASPGAGEAEWMRNRLGSDTVVRLLVTGEIGPKEIGRLIRLLEAQKSVLTDDEDLIG